MFRLHFHFAGNQPENCQPKTQTMGCRLEKMLTEIKMWTAEYRVQKHILCYNIITVSNIDLTTNFIDMRASHQNPPAHLAVVRALAYHQCVRGSIIIIIVVIVISIYNIDRTLRAL